ncbi:hypothetical protein LGH82_21645 [Mesorhizobium sp. PAMC28654]|uniref:hypothetical protein n=1 Tax=Mesorhizobium sp. PAMC28654 TaxID=2880934 RepID=UPI001D09B4E3|nr:hypothetical protein [Mesorhizobium sp. PAMC28654]UDL87764.1 hypothetical protein LGH82_21645 [Mesorhizobium sp. PAMC28654]
MSVPPPETSERPWLYFPDRKELGTGALQTFVKDCSDIFNMFMFSVTLAHGVDENRVRAAKALLKAMDPASEDYLKYQKTLDNPDAMAKRLAQYATLNARNLVTGTADSFLWYLSKIIQMAIKKRPELLKSSESIKIDDLMHFRRRTELVEYLIDKKVNELSYGGMKKMEQYFQDRLGISAFGDASTRDMLVLFMEVRNIYVHNRGYVNSVFLERVDNAQGLKPVLGERLHIDFDWYARFQGAAVGSAVSIDRAVAGKFGLKRKRLRNWDRPGVRLERVSDPLPADQETGSAD